MGYKEKKPKNVASASKEDYLAMLLEPEHFDLDKRGMAKLIGVDVRTLYRWDKDLDWNWIKDERRKLYASRISAIDFAMIKKAKKGDTRAAELMYKRFDEWVDTTKVIDAKENLQDDELKDMAKAIGEELAQQEGTRKPKKSNPVRTRKKKA
jgi:hypothetical protein